MSTEHNSIERNYERFYADRVGGRVYPTEFVVRTFLARYPQLNFMAPSAGDAVLEVGFGDGRNTKFLCEQGYEVFGVELTETICTFARERLNRLNFSVDLRVGRNSTIPFKDSKFKCLLAVHSCYYVDPGQIFLQNLAEYSRVLDDNGWLIVSVPSVDSYIFDGAEKLSDGSFVIKKDPYLNRNGYRLHGFQSAQHIAEVFGKYFYEFSIGWANNNFFGIRESAFWVVCKNKKKR